MNENELTNQHLVIFRTGCSILNLNTYNCQELGLAKALSSKGLKVSLILAGNKVSADVVDGITVYRLPFKAINQQLGIFLGYKELLMSLKPSLIQVHDMGIYMTYAVTKWASNHKIPCFLIQGNYETTKKPVFKQLESVFNMFCGRYVLKHVSGIGCKTQMASRYVQSYLNRKTKMTYIGLDVSKFSNSINREWKKELNIHTKKVLLYVGSLEQRRNPLFLLDVLRHLPDDYVLLIAGDGSLKQEVEEKIISEKRSDRCFLLGKLSQAYLPSLYKIADVFLLASNYEIYGMVILEAMYFGVPVISSYTAGSESLIDDGKDGFVIESLDVAEWCNAICCAMNNNSMKKNARDKIENCFVWEKTANQFLELYFRKD